MGLGGYTTTEQDTHKSSHGIILMCFVIMELGGWQEVNGCRCVEIEKGEGERLENIYVYVWGHRRLKMMQVLIRMWICERCWFIG